MATTDIGRVTPIWRGFYSAATTYELNDLVIDNSGSVWWHKSEDQTTGVAPVAGEIWDAVIDMSEFSGLIQAAITTAQTALAAAQAALADVATDMERAETAAQNAENSATAASESAAGVGALAQAAAASAAAAEASETSASGSATSAAGSAEEAEAWATGGSGGTATATNNAKYYSEQSSASATSAASSASAAQDVLDSIPEDYSQLSEDVSDLKTQLRYSAYDDNKKDLLLANIAENFSTDKIDFSVENTQSADTGYYWGFVVKKAMDVLTIKPIFAGNTSATWKRYTNGLGTVFASGDTYTQVDEGYFVGGENVVITDLKLGEFVLFESDVAINIKNLNPTPSDISNTYTHLIGFKKVNSTLTLLNYWQIVGTYTVLYIDSANVIDMKNMVDNVPALAESVGFEPGYISPNIFNKDDSDIQTGGYIGSDGNFVSNEGFWETGYIPVTNGDVLRCIYDGVFMTNSGVIIALYDAQKTFIATITRALNYINITTANAAYMRSAMLATALASKLVITKNDETLYTSYLPYGQIPPKSTLLEDVTELAEKVENIESVTPLQWTGKNCVCIGDSIMWYDGHEFANTDVVAVGYPSYMRDVLKLTVSNQGVSGACVAYHSERPYVDNVTTVDSIDFSGYDLAVLEGGINDYIVGSVIGTIAEDNFDKTTFCGAYQYIIEKILTQNPTIQIVMFLPYKIVWQAAQSTIPLTDYITAIKAISEHYSIPLVNLYGECGFNFKNIVSQYTIDGLHANNDGYKRTNDILIKTLTGLGIISQG